MKLTYVCFKRLRRGGHNGEHLERPEPSYSEAEKREICSYGFDRFESGLCHNLAACLHVSVIHSGPLRGEFY